jgi:DNA anti-recombination protein RmuC
LQEQKGDSGFYESSQQPLTNHVMKTFLKIAVTVLITYCLLSMANCSSPDRDHQNSSSWNKDVKQEREKLAQDLRDLRVKIDKKLDETGTKIDRASDDTKQRLLKAKQDLQHERNKVDRALKDVEHSTEETWSDVREGARNTFRDVKKEFNDLGDRLADLFSSAS